MSLVLLWGKRFHQVFPNKDKNMYKTSSGCHVPVCEVQEPWNQNQWLFTRSRRPEKDLEVFVRVSDWLDSLWVVDTVKNSRTKTVELFVYGSSRQQQLNAARGFSINRCGSFEERRSLIWWFGLKTTVTVCDVSAQTGLTGHMTWWSEPLAPGPEFTWGGNTCSCAALYCVFLLHCLSNYVMSCFSSPLLWLVGSCTFLLNWIMMWLWRRPMIWRGSKDLFPCWRWAPLQCVVSVCCVCWEQNTENWTQSQGRT